MWVAISASAIGCGVDVDGDGFRKADCDDLDASVNPEAAETCNGVDDNCDGYIDEDVSFVAYWDRDGDGFGDVSRARRVCALPADGTTVAGDCDDSDPNSSPSAIEQCDGRDQDCDGTADNGVTTTYYVDNDHDGHGGASATAQACDVAPPGYASAADDCDDTDPNAWTNAPEQCDEADNDCDGVIDEDVPLTRVWVDADGDGGGDPSKPALACGAITGFATGPSDCDDTDLAIGPNATEIADNAQDEDCDGWTDERAVPDHFPDVAAAIDGARPGDVIQVGAGTWYVTLDLTGRDLVLAGEGCDQTVLYGEGSGSVITTDSGWITAMTISGGYAEFGGGILANGDVLVTDVCVQGNAASNSGGGLAIVSGDVTLENALIAQNSAANDGGGVSVAQGASVDVVRSNFIGNEAVSDAGALYGYDALISVESSSFLDNTARAYGAAITVRKAESTGGSGALSVSHATFDHNISANNGAAVYLYNLPGRVSDVVLAHHTAGDLPLIYSNAPTTSLTLGPIASWGNRGPESTSGWIASAVRDQPRWGLRDSTVAAPLQDVRLLAGSDWIDLASDADPDGSAGDLGATGGPQAVADWNAGYQLDADGDGVFDLWEATAGTNPWVADAESDRDGDGLSTRDELALECDPRSADTDIDGVSDGAEVASGGNPTDASDQAPVADAGTPGWALIGEPLTVGTLGSHDPNGDPLAFTWEVRSVPFGSAVSSVADPTAEVTSLLPDVKGPYALRLTVSDGRATATHDVVINAFDAWIVPDDVATPAEAVAMASDGDAIAVRPGEWSGALDFAGKSLVMFGLGAAGDVVLDAAGDGSTVRAAVGEHPTLAHVTLTGGVAENGGGIYVSGGGVDLDAVIVVGNTATGDGGGLWASGGDVRVRDSRFEDNVAGGDGGGLYVDRPTLDVVRSSFLGNAAGAAGGGLYAISPTAVDHSVRNSAFIGNVAPVGAAIHRSGASARLDLPQGLIAENRGGTSIYVASGELWAFNDVAVDHADGAVFSRAASLANVDVLYPVLADNLLPFSFSADDVGANGTYANPDMIAYIDATNPAADRFAPRLGSPAIDAGHPELFDVAGGRADAGPAGGADAARDARRWTSDTDRDGVADGWESVMGLDPAVADAEGDADTDGLANRDEYRLGTHPLEPDTDGDGVTDGAEVAAGGDPADPADHRPTARVGGDVLVQVGTTATVDGASSTDPDGDPLTFRWRLLAKPVGSTLASSDIVASGTSARLTPDARGRFRLGLTVTDGYTFASEVSVAIDAWDELAVPDDYPTLADAVADAGDHDVILLGDGTFDGPIDPAGRTLTIAGQGKEKSVIRGTTAGPVVSISGGETLTLRDLAITGAAGDEGGAIRCDGGAVVGSGLSLANNVAYRGAGIAALSDCEVTFRDVDATGNLAYDKGAAAYTYTGTIDWSGGYIAENETEASVAAGVYAYLGTLHLTRLRFVDNVAGTSGPAVYASASTSTLDHLTVHSNTGSSGPILISTGTASITNSLITENQDYGIQVLGTTSVTVNHNGYYRNTRGPTYPASLLDASDVLLNPRYADDDLRLTAGSPMIDAGTDVDPDGTASDLGAWGGIDADDDYDLYSRDTDTDGLSDGWEQRYGLSEFDPSDAAIDVDGDGLIATDELTLETSPIDPDTDADGVDDQTEAADGDDPTDPSDHAPTAYGGTNKAGAPGDTFTMYGIGVEPDGERMSYAWALTSAPGRSTRTSADIRDADRAACSFEPDTPGVYVLVFTVTDGVATDTDAVELRVSGDLYVPDDYATVTDAIGSATDGATIYVEAGSYEATGIDLDGRSITVVGDGSAVTTLEAGDRRAIVGDDAESLTLMGLTMTGGLATRGGAVLLDTGALTADDVVFSGNRAGDGGALSLTDVTTTLTDVWFLDNATPRDGGAIAATRGSIDGVRVVFQSNTAESDGGALYASGAAISLENVLATGNSAYNGGALYLRTSSLLTAELSHVTAVGNLASYGGFIYDSGIPLTMRDSIIAHNTKYAYAMVYMDSDLDGRGDSTLAQSTTDLWQNTTSSDTKEVYFSATSLCCTPVAGTDGNLAVDPAFADYSDDGDPTNDDLTLLTGSPAIDAGSDTDTDGSAADLGAYGGPNGSW
jgi:predicted outer membrane repeat protein